MKRSLLSMLLAIALLLGGIVWTVPASAEEAKQSPSSAETYDALYVKNGLVAWYDAYDAASVNLSTGVWSSKAGYGSNNATLASPELWKMRTGGGVGFDMQSYSTWASYKGKVAVVLNKEDFPANGDYTIEFVMKLDGLVDASGNDLPHTQQMNGNRYGLYNEQLSAWCFGPMHYMQFMLSADSSSSLNMRAMYSEENSYMLTDGKESEYLSDFVGIGGLHEQKTYAVSFDYTAPSTGEYATAQYVWYTNNDAEYSFVNKKATSDSFQKFHDSRSGNFRLMGDFPGTVYNIRIYDHVLTDAEREQNYFVDVYRGLGLNVDGVAALSEAHRKELYHATALLFREVNEANYQQALDLLNCFYRDGDTALASFAISYVGMQARLDTAGVRAVFRSNNQLIEILEKRYTVRYGGIVALGERNGEELLSVEDLVVTDTGAGFEAENGRAVVVYSSKGDYGATNEYVHLSGSGDHFAITTLFDGAGATDEYYNFGMCYRAFLAVTGSDGKTEIFYFNVEGENFGTETSTYGKYISMLEMADYYVNRYDESVVKAYSYNENEVLRDVLLECGSKAVAYRPGGHAETQVDLYVNVAAASGGDGSEGKPFRTIAEAYAAAKTAFKSYDNIAVTVHLADGVYRTEETISLSGADITAKNYWFTVEGSENAVVTGNKLLSASFSKVANTNYYVANVGTNLDFRYLTVNGEFADLAYQGYRRYAAAVEAGTTPWRTGNIQNCKEGDANYNAALGAWNYKVYLHPDAFKNVNTADVQGIELHIEVEWEYEIMHIDRIDATDKDSEGRIAVYIDEGDFNAVVKPNLPYVNRYYWLENALAFVDTPGEYYYDKAAGKLYYYPREGETVGTCTYEYGTVEKVFAFDNVKNITLEGFTVTGTDNRYVETNGYYDGSQAGGTSRGMHEYAAIYGIHVQNGTFYRMNIKNVAADGIQIGGGMKNIDVDSCKFTNIGASAVRLGNGNAKWSDTNCLDGGSINNNLLDNVAWYFRQNVALYVTIAKDFQLTHNSIYNCSYSAISVGWSWSSVDWRLGQGYNLYNVEIAYNYIENYMTDMSDGGAIYTTGGNVAPDYTGYINQMHHNYVVENALTGAGNGRFMSLYHDGASSNWHSYENVVFTANHVGNSGLGSFFVQTGSEDPASQQAHNILAEKNYFINACREDWNSTSVDGKVITGITSEQEYIEKVLFYGHLRPEYNTVQKDTVCVESIENANEECLAIMSNAGSSLRSHE